MRGNGGSSAAATRALVVTPVAIRRVVWETDDIFTLMLDLAPLGDSYAFKPGQFNMVYQFGVGESAISISSDPAKRNQIQHTIHRVGAVTNELAKLRHGDMVGLRGPFGAHWPVEEAKGKDVCIVGGGIGLAPLRPILYTLFHHRREYRRIYLLYGARAPRDLLYRVELEQWAKQHDVEVHVTVDRGDTSWKGNIGVVTTLFTSVTLDPAGTVAFVCGPETMMKYTLIELEKQGLPQDRIYLSMERNMKCAVGFCGHCQYGPEFICKDGPVFPLGPVRHLLEKKEI